MPSLYAKYVCSTIFKIFKVKKYSAYVCTAPVHKES